MKKILILMISLGLLSCANETPKNYVMLQGKVAGPGVLPPEACINPQDFLALLPQVMQLDEKKEGGERFGGVIVEEVDEAGHIRKLDI
jgi:saccharopine dehydrogenase (NAD+, L-lysine-forming)